MQIKAKAILADKSAAVCKADPAMLQFPAFDENHPPDSVPVIFFSGTPSGHAAATGVEDFRLQTDSGEESYFAVHADEAF